MATAELKERGEQRKVRGFFPDANTVTDPTQVVLATLFEDLSRKNIVLTPDQTRQITTSVTTLVHDARVRQSNLLMPLAIRIVHDTLTQSVPGNAAVQQLSGAPTKPESLPKSKSPRFLRRTLTKVF